MQTLEQERAEYAWAKVKGQNGNYRSLVKSAPAMVMTNGLMQTLAFLQGKGQKQKHHKDLLVDITGWLKEKGILSETDFSKVMSELYKKSSSEYQRATEEAMAILRWLRHLVDAAISGEEQGGHHAG